MKCKILLIANKEIAHVYKLKGFKVHRKLYTLEVKDLITVHQRQGHRENFFAKASLQSHLLDPHQEAQEINRKNFSLAVCESLKALYQKQRFDSLVIIAEAKVLGDLRKHLDQNILHLPPKEIVKDLTHYNHADIEKYLLG